MRRKIAAWPIACAVLLILLVAGWFGWNWADGLAEGRAAAEAAACQEGDADIRVLVAPSARQPVAAAAETWAKSKSHVVHGHCITVNVEAMPEKQAFDTVLAGGRNMPAAWMPEMRSSVETLAEKRPNLIGSSAKSVAYHGKATYPYVTFAGDGIDEVQERAAQAFRVYLMKPGQQRAFNDAGLTQR